MFLYVLFSICKKKLKQTNSHIKKYGKLNKQSNNFKN